MQSHLNYCVAICTANIDVLGDAEKFLGTNAIGIKKLIDDKKIQFETNGRINSSRIYIHIQSLIEVKYHDQ